MAKVYIYRCPRCGKEYPLRARGIIFVSCRCGVEMQFVRTETEAKSKKPEEKANVE